MTSYSGRQDQGVRSNATIPYPVTASSSAIGKSQILHLFINRMQNNSYTLSRDCCSLKSCMWICICPGICPDPCCGTKNQSYFKYDIRANGNRLHEGDGSLREIHQQVKSNNLPQGNIGQVRGNIDYPYCCWFAFLDPCCAKYYDALQISGNKLGSMIYNCSCRNIWCTTCPEYPYEQSPDNQRGSINPNYCCCPYVTIHDQNGNEQFILKRQCCFCSCCTIPYKIFNSSGQHVSNIMIDQCVCLSACNIRYQIDVDLPPKATQAQKKKILLGSTLCI